MSYITVAQQQEIRDKCLQVMRERIISARKAHAEIGMAYPMLLKFLKGKGLNPESLFRIEAWIKKNQAVDKQ